MGMYIQVIAATGSKSEAEKISRAVVKSRLAGCAQVLGPITSVYRWKGELEVANEWLCIMKSRTDLYKDLESMVRQNHSYDVPEILATPITEASDAYLAWLEGELKT